jgi:general secretion pathway protein D
MNTHHPRARTAARRWSAWLSLGLLLMALWGCAAQRAYDDGRSLLAAGQAQAGLSRLEEAVARDPANAQYRIELALQKSRLVQDALRKAGVALREGKLDDANALYGFCLSLDPGQAMARQGADEVQRERRRVAGLDEAERLIARGGAAELAQAGERLREVLSANAQHQRALALKARLEQAQSQQPKPETRLLAAYKKPITLEFRDAPLKSVFDLIAKLSGLNFYFDKDVKADQKTTILARNSSIEDAVRLVLSSNQLEQKVLNGNSLLIYPSTPTKLREYQTLVVRSFYLVNADVKAVVNTLKTIVKTKDIVFDERVGLVIIRDTPQAVRMAERIVALQDMTDPEVMLEVEVMEVKRSRLLELGVQWPSQMVLSPLQVSGSPLTLSTLKSIGTSTTQVSLGNMNINARKEDQDSNILANPRIRVRNKEKAKILIGDKVPVITSTSTATGFASESVSYIDVGLKLDVEPNVYLDDEVAIKVNLEVSNLVREVTSKTGALSYQIGTRGASTVLRLKDGETQILAGLISDEDRSTANKVPGLGELPLLGRLFGSQKDDTQRNEILLSITPRVVRAVRRPDLEMMEFESGTEANVGADTVRLTPLPADTRSATPTSLAPPANLSADDSAVGDAVVFSWKAPDQVKVGEAWAAVLNVDAKSGLSAAPLLLEFDPGAWEFNSVMEGAFLKGGGAATAFTSEVDAKRGRVLIKLNRQAAGNGEALAKGQGDLLTLNLRAIKANPGGAAIKLLAAAPEPTPATPLVLPVEQRVKVAP